MSSDTFRTRILAVEGSDVIIEAQPTTAAGLCDIPVTRSFVLLLLTQYDRSVATLDQTLDVAWLEQHLDDFVVGVRIDRIKGFTHEGLLRQIGAQWQIPAEHLQPRVTLRATMASEALAQRFVVGDCAGTTAFDVWGFDPKRAAIPGAIESPDPFGSTPFEPADINAAVLERAPRWKHAPLLDLHRENDGVCLRVVFWPGGYELRPGFRASVTLWVPGFSALGGKKRGEIPNPCLLRGSVAPLAVPCWMRQYRGDDTQPQDLAYFADDAPLEDIGDCYSRLARTLEEPAVDVLLTRDGAIGLVEDLVASLPSKDKPTNHARLGGGVAPSLSSSWTWQYEPKTLWLRVLMHAALGTREDANAALAQARAKSKRPPKELKILIASLDADEDAS